MSYEKLRQFPRHSVSQSVSSVTQSCPALCDPMDCSPLGLPVHHQLPEFTQTHAHRVGDAIQPSHSLSSPSPPAPNLFQHQGLFQWVPDTNLLTKLSSLNMSIWEKGILVLSHPNCYRFISKLDEFIPHLLHAWILHPLRVVWCNLCCIAFFQGQAEFGQNHTFVWSALVSCFAFPILLGVPFKSIFIINPLHPTHWLRATSWRHQHTNLWEHFKRVIFQFSLIFPYLMNFSSVITLGSF